jgi:peptidoglycan/xylan/chitin deacetylase (PgdA/CDA1 family)
MANLIYKGNGQSVFDCILEKFARQIDQAGTVKKQIQFFFRADDIGVPSKNFDRMMQLFIAYEVPLCLAVVPVWMTGKRWQAMEEYQEKASRLFCWHMHGYGHKNYERNKKKHEFGPTRAKSDIFRELTNGRDRLLSLMGSAFTPVFTPPWNRCSQETLMALKQLDFKGVSRSYGASPPPIDGLKDMVVHVDLHTRKDKTSDLGREKLVEEFNTGVLSEACGIMLHHMRMDQAAFAFLEALLGFLTTDSRIKLVTYKELLRLP